MGIMIISNIKKNINSNLVFMVAMSTIFVLLSTVTQNSEISVVGYSYFEILLKGYVFLYIIFSCELNKNLLETEKLSKRLEWFLANGIKLKRIVFSYSISLFLLTQIIMIPPILIAIFNSGEFLMIPIIEYLIVTFIYSIIENIIILNTQNMNKFRSISVKILILNLIVVVIENIGIYMRLDYIYIHYLLLILLMTILGILLKNEKVVNSYY